MSNNTLNVVILAAGKGTRMHSHTPKVLHPLAGKPLAQHVIDTVSKLCVRQIYLVYGYAAEQLKQKLTGNTIQWVHQQHQAGTGHAVQQAAKFFPDNERVLILYGDVPLITMQTLQQLCNACPPGGIALLTAHLEDPTGYGRILRENGHITGIIEQKDASEQQRQITEINTGVMVARGADLKHWLGQITNHNAQQEYYLTDIISLACQQGRRIVAIHPRQLSEIQGVNNRLQLAQLERICQQEQAQRLLLAGVMLQDPARFDLRGCLEFGQDVEIDINVVLEGQITLGNRVKIGAGCVIKNCVIGDDCQISPYTVMENARLAPGCSVGPFARLRPGAELEQDAHVGNFVEMKNTRLGKGSKAGHLSYLGDTQIGDSVNIGAGVITCNYDGASKHQTLIGDDVFVGSATQLVAPVAVGQGATIGAGSTITRDIAPQELVITRVPQRHITGWQRPQKKK